MKLRSLKIIILASLLAMSSLLAHPQDQRSVEKLTQREAEARVQSVTTNNQVKALIASAKTPDDHRKLAAYFNQEADRLEADAKGHAELADAYRQHPHSTGGGKQSGAGSIFQTAEHCDSAAKSLREAAKDLRELAAEHEQMAKDVAQ